LALLRAAGTLAAGACLGGVLLAGRGAPAARAEAAAASDDATILHLLNRLTWGPRPGDLAAVRAMGLERWTTLQLHPERIDDRALEARLADFPTLRLSSAALVQGYELPPPARRELQQHRAELEAAAPDERARLRRELTARYAPKMKGTPEQVLEDRQAARVLRAVASARQLDDVLADFWLNHFNVFAQKGQVRYLLGEHERVIREHQWGRFEDLLLATARSPAMLFYLDNWLSTTAHPEPPRARRRPRFPPPSAATAPARRGGLNENYARELLELHTLGVDGGYTQQDVTEVARAFTGWTIASLREGQPRFAFEERRHDRGDKRVLGHVVRDGGEREGREILHRLATHPATARHLALQLAQRFVADDPPPALVERAAQVFLRTQGEIREVVRAIVTSPEFLSPAVRSAKVKTPLEYAVSAIRASGARVFDPRALAQRIGAMGMPLYLQQPPTGYKDTADAWVSTSSLVARLNLALDLAAGRIPGVSFDASALAGEGSRAQEADALAARLVPAGLSEATRREVEAGGLEPARLAGMILGSPEFQRR